MNSPEFLSGDLEVYPLHNISMLRVGYPPWWQTLVKFNPRIMYPGGEYLDSLRINGKVC
jgi:hypothetical protein